LATWKIPIAEEMQIVCEELRNGEVCYGELVITKKQKPKLVKIVCEGKEIEISRESAITLNLIST